MTLRLLALTASFCAAAASAAPAIEGCPVFPADNTWNARVDRLPVHPRSETWIDNVAAAGNGATRGFHMDFGSGLWEGAPIGIPYVTVPGTQPKVPVTFEYGDESDPGPYPIPPNAPIEGVGPPNAGGDRHVLVIDRDNCMLYETFASYPQNGGASWTAGSGAVFDLNDNELRPIPWTSADAAGLPIFPGLVRYEEVQAGVIEHALRFTAQRTDRSFVWPARHQAGHSNNANLPPMGARFRLKASYDISGFSPQARVIAQAMKTYGIVLADNGSPWYVSGAPHAGWDNDVLHELDVLKGADFEAVDTSGLVLDPDSGEARQPTAQLSVATDGTGVAFHVGSVGSPMISCGVPPPPGPFCTNNFPLGAQVTLEATPGAGTAFAGWSGDCSGTAPCVLTMDRGRNVVATFAASGEQLVIAPAGPLDLGTFSMGAASQEIPLTITNIGGTALPFNGISFTGSAAFSGTHTCGAQLASGQSCLVQLTFKPPTGASGLNSTDQHQATLNLVSHGASLAVSGRGEKSLVPHFYRSILERPPEPAGHAFWRAEAARLAGLGANVNETWFVLANYFFNSAEYSSLQRSDAEFVTNLYRTFFARDPDGPGLAFWTGQIAGGLRREVVLFSFMFSNEFRTFTQGIFGNTAARPEVDLVMDLFRGILNRLPDTAAFNFWVGQLRAAQCQGAGAVYAKANEISYAFLFGAEYEGRGRNHAQFVADLYNAFLRRGGDKAGVDFWINQLASGARSRNAVRGDFIASPEFAARVNAVVTAGCMP